jgi:hypothetical protein
MMVSGSLVQPKSVFGRVDLGNGEFILHFSPGSPRFARAEPLGIGVRVTATRAESRSDQPFVRLSGQARQVSEIAERN